MKSLAPKKTIGDSILSFRKRTAEKAVIFKKKSSWTSKSWLEYYEDIETIGAGILSLGVEPQDRVAVMSNTRYEWSVVDYAVMGIQGVVVSVYQNNTPQDVEFILNNSGAEVLVLENEGLLKTWNEIKDRCPKIRAILLIDSKGAFEDPSFLSWKELQTRGQNKLQKSPECFEKLCRNLNLRSVLKSYVGT